MDARTLIDERSNTITTVYNQLFKIMLHSNMLGIKFVHFHQHDNVTLFLENNTKDRIMMIYNDDDHHNNVDNYV